MNHLGETLLRSEISENLSAQVYFWGKKYKQNSCFYTSYMARIEIPTANKAGAVYLRTNALNQ
jgi:hypothetical protein